MKITYLLDTIFRLYNESGAEIGYIGILGSKDVSNDIDLIFLPGDVKDKYSLILSYFKFLSELKKKLKKEDISILPFTWLNYQSEVKYLGNNKKALMIHCLFFISNPFLESSRKHYKYLPMYEKFEEFISKSEKICGDLKRVKNSGVKPYKNEYEFDLVRSLVELFANYPAELKKDKVNLFVTYIQKHSGDEKLVRLIREIYDLSEEN